MLFKMASAKRLPFCHDRKTVMWWWSQQEEEPFNSLGPRDACMRHHTGSSLVQIMACRLFGAEPLSEPILDNFKMDNCEQISVTGEFPSRRSVFSLISTWTSGWPKNGDAGDLSRHRAHYYVTVMKDWPRHESSIYHKWAKENEVICETVRHQAHFPSLSCLIVRGCTSAIFGIFHQLQWKNFADS